MRQNGGGIGIFTPLLLASLLLHLIVLVAANNGYRRQLALRPPPAIMVDYLLNAEPKTEHGAKTPSPGPRPRTTGPRADAPRRSATGPSPAPPAKASPAKASPAKASALRSAPAAAPAPAISAEHKPKPASAAAAAPAPVPAAAPVQQAALRDVSRGTAPAAGVVPASTVKTEGAQHAPGKGTGATAAGAGSGAGSKGVSPAGGGNREGGGLGAAQAGRPAATAGGSLERRGAYQELLKRLVESHKRYPFAALKARQEGSCGRRFVLSRNGSLKGVEELSTCGHPLLDEAATRAITSVGAFPPFPESFEGAEKSFDITLTFVLARH